MTKYFSANFMLECIIPENSDKPDFILRDQRGNICCRGEFKDVSEFIQETFNEFKSKQSQSVESAKN